MSHDSSTIDRIVAGILHQISFEATVRAVASPIGTIAARHSEGTTLQKSTIRASVDHPHDDSQPFQVDDKVVTAGVLTALPIGTAVRVGAKAIVTPAAWDTARERSLTISRSALSHGNRAVSSSAAASGSTGDSTGMASRLLIVVRNTEAVDQLRANLDLSWRRELTGCPDDAAKLAISELTRGGAASVVIFAEQAHRAACLANRHEQVKAVVARDLVDIKQSLQQLRVNTWCIDPNGRSWFELRNMMQAIEATTARK